MKDELCSFFSGLVENIFCSELGVVDPEVPSYFSNLLVSYSHIDDCFPFRRNQTIVSLDKLVEEAKTEEKRRKLFQSAGDFTIFWSGVYPENIANLQSVGIGYNKEAYINSGRKFYKIASDLTSIQKKAQLLKDLSINFDEYCHGLFLCRQEFR